MDFNLDYLLIAIGATLMILGIIGCVAPVLPGVVFNYLGILLLHFTQAVDFSMQFLLLWALVVVAVELLNYYIPIWGTKQFGGGKKGVWGCTIGVFVGIFFIPPWGIILFPFVGAVIGELLDQKSFGKSLKAGFGAFIGFVAGTLMQLVVAFILTFYFFKEVIGLWF